jgi:NAD(P)H-dependent flavin oxidoreductase YrpB (nitropropane dioxygenase family)
MVAKHSKKFEGYQKKILMQHYDMPPNSLKVPNVGLKLKQRKKKRVGARSLIHNTLGVGGHVGALGWD